MEYLWRLASYYSHARNANFSGPETDSSLQGHVHLMSLICPCCLPHYEEPNLFDLSVWRQTSWYVRHLMFDALLGSV